MPPKRKAQNDASSPAKVRKVEEQEVTEPDENGGGDAASVAQMDFSSNASTKSGVAWNTKIVSLNVNGFRAWLKKGGMEYIVKESADVYGIQETKCSAKEIPEAELEAAGYSAHFLSGDKAGYSGVGIIYKKKPLNITDGIGIEKHDGEARVITAEYDDYYLVIAYVPNSGRGLKRLDYRTKEWDDDFHSYLRKLDEKKPVILGGDLNVAHNEIDLKNPKSNKNKTPGFCDGERDGMTKLLGSGFIDSFRHLNPDKADAYTFWSYMGNARAKNVGWRLDYFLISKRLEEKLCDSTMRTKVMGSDHCPITLFMAL